ncbi:MAG: glycosyltransferase [Chitinivibrionia bacterium]|nr:glycosyltransferase [Chitinivibrionia bacterium]
MDCPKISIITPVFNGAKTISDTLASVSMQSYKNIEHIIVDGLSTDKTIDIVKKYENKNMKIISEPDSGVYDALNKGVKLASGDIIGILHSDDLYADKDVVSKISEHFSDISTDGVYTDLVYVQKKDTNKIFRHWESCDFCPDLLKKGWMPPHPTVFLRKSIYEKLGDFDTSYKIAADYDFMLRIFSTGANLKYLHFISYKMRAGGMTNRSISNIICKSRENLRTFKKYNIGSFSALFYKNFSKVEQFF